MLGDDRIRVYAAFSDEARVGRIGYVDVDARDPLRILGVAEQPALDIGVPGAFDDNGVSPICIVREGDDIHLFYNGWQLGARVRYFLFLGLATSSDGGETYVRRSQVPILDRADGELFFRTAACVLRDGERWKMWYIGGGRWVDSHGKQVPEYNLRYLESDRFDRWGGPGRVAMDVRGGDEHGFGRPFVIREDDRYVMWYSARTMSKRYRIGYAESPDGVQWTRLDEQAGIDVSDSGWDSEMTAYPCVQKTRFGTYMFYNGNNYGETGFGVAILEP